MDHLIGWLMRHGRRSGVPGNYDTERDDIDARQAAIARRIHALQVQTDALRRPPPPPDDSAD
jgi:hypothetical protein